MEAKCSCQHCGKHIAFAIEDAGQTVECPHCNLETLLFVPPVATPLVPKNRNANTIRLLVAAICVVACGGAVIFLRKSPKQIDLASEPNLPIQTNQPTVEPSKELQEQINLRPVVSAFGWTLGDQLPERFRTEVRESDYSTSFFFKPETDWPPFNSFVLDLTPDGRICCIHATAVIFNGSGEDFYTAKNRVVSVLSDKYGLREHKRKDYPNPEEYTFGTVDQTALLEIMKSDDNNQLWLEYYDKNLKSIADGIHDAKRAKDESRRKAALSNGL